MNPGYRNNIWDLVVIGGGVTGAGVFLEAVNRGWRVLLVERNDFAWGTSSRSSKMVHGGLRYLKEGKPRLTRSAVKERERLLRELPGLVDPLGFLMPVYSDYGPSRLLMGLGLSVYSLMALEKQHTGYNSRQISEQIPYLRQEHLTGGFYFKDAQVDDARLVLRLIYQGVANGGRARNYTAARKILRDGAGQVTGLVTEDVASGQQTEIRARAVINATGVWAERFQPSPERGLHLRPLRGSHLIFPGHRFPVPHVVSFLHPQDKRPVFMFPWEGAVILGTTDIDHEQDLDANPAIAPAETQYLMEGLHFIMPGLPLSIADCMATIAGIRPVLSKGGAAASQESREHVVWRDRGLITITGGKLTTFRLLARDALKAAWAWLPPPPEPSRRGPVFVPADSDSANLQSLPADIRRRLSGRYGPMAPQVAENIARPEQPDTVPGTNTLWAELAYAAEKEQVRHLSDLLLRRTRLGLICPGGGQDLLEQVQAVCQPYLDWDEQRWETEKARYRKTWQRFYAPPDALVRDNANAGNQP